jgi:hypothetical protein
VLIVLKSGSLNLLEPYRSVQVCNGIALPYLSVIHFDYSVKKAEFIQDNGNRVKQQTTIIGAQTFKFANKTS